MGMNQPANSPPLIRPMQMGDIADLYAFCAPENHFHEESYFEICLLEQKSSTRQVYLIHLNDELAGYCHYVKTPRYQPFRSLDIPEIQDLFIGQRYRRHGLATLLIEQCCKKAMEDGHDLIGLGVGLEASFGKAQKLYVKLGFEPDGAGLVYDRKAVPKGQSCTVDDALCLMMIKQLR
jgi:GNAT superfamily N-acetyltransferase